MASETDVNSGDATFPTDPSATPSASYWDNIGYSEGGFSQKMIRHLKMLWLQKRLIRLRQSKLQEVRITGELAQASLRNLKFAMAGGTTTADTPSAGYTTLVPPTTDSFEENHCCQELMLLVMMKLVLQS